MDRRCALGATAATLLSALTGVHAQTAADFPQRAVRLVVPFPPGGAVDSVARALAQHLAQEWKGATVVTDNKPGGNGVIAADTVAKAPPDGHTLLLTTDAPLVAAPYLTERLPYDPLGDFTALAGVAVVPLVLVANPEVLPAKSVPQLVTLLKAAPGKYAYASNGEGGGNHVLMEQFQAVTGTLVNHIPYKGSTQASLDVVAGRVPLMFSAIAGVLPQIRSGKLVALGTSNATRSELLPEVPTISEQGFPRFQRAGWMGVLGPRNMPAPLAERIERALRQVLTSADSRQAILATGTEPTFTTGSELQRRIADDHKGYGEVMARLRKNK